MIEIDVMIVMSVMILKRVLSVSAVKSANILKRVDPVKLVVMMIVMIVKSVMIDMTIEVVAFWSNMLLVVFPKVNNGPLFWVTIWKMKSVTPSHPTPLVNPR